MGTLTAPPTTTFLTRIRNGKMAGVIFLGNDWLTRSKVKHITTRAAAGGVHARRAAPRRARPGGRDRQAPRRTRRRPRRPRDMKSPSDAHAQAAGAAAALRAGRRRHRLRAGRRHAELAEQLPRLARVLRARERGTRRWGRRSSAACSRTAIAATAKHFPGLGLAGGNTDNGQITINASKAKIEPGLLPFQAAIKAGVKLVMVNTAIYPHLDASARRGVLGEDHQRDPPQQLGFKGVTVTDSLTAPAPSRSRTRDEGDARRLRPPHLGSESRRSRATRRSSPTRRARGAPRGSPRPPPDPALKRGSPPRRPELQLDRQPHLVGNSSSWPLRADDYDALYAARPTRSSGSSTPTTAGARTSSAILREHLAAAARCHPRPRRRNVIGTSRYHGYDAERARSRSVDVPRRSHWGGAVNGEVKQLMLEHAFRSVERVVFLAAVGNLRSRRAIEKLGATFVEITRGPASTARARCTSSAGPRARAARASRRRGATSGAP